MRPPLYLVVVAINGLSVVQALANDPGSTPLPLVVEKHSTAKIQYSHVKIKNGGSNEGIIQATLRIEELIAEGFIAQWTTNSVSVGGTIVDKNHPQAGSFFIGIPFNYVADSDGTPLKIHNREKLLSALEESDVFSGMDKKALRKTLDFFAGMPEEALAQIFLKVPSYMSFCQGTNLKIGERIADQVSSPNPFGDGTIVSDVSYTLHSVDYEKKQAEIEYNLQFNPDSLRKITKQFADKLVSKETFDSKEIEQASISRNDSAICLLDTETGWVKTMDYSTAIAADKDLQIEKFSISINWN